MYLNNQEIEKELISYDTDTKALKHELLKLSWYMRGGVPFSEMMNLSIEERVLITKIVEENLAATKESGLPFF